MLSLLIQKYTKLERSVSKDMEMKEKQEKCKKEEKIQALVNTLNEVQPKSRSSEAEFAQEKALRSSRSHIQRRWKRA